MSDDDLPKAAHRTDWQRAIGYLNAAQVSLGTAGRLGGAELSGATDDLINEIEQLKERLHP